MKLLVCFVSVGYFAALLLLLKRVCQNWRLKVKKGYIKPMSKLVPSLMQHTIIILAALLASRCCAYEITQEDGCFEVKYYSNTAGGWMTDNVAALTDHDYSTVFTKSDVELIELWASCGEILFNAVHLAMDTASTTPTCTISVYVSTGNSVEYCKTNVPYNDPSLWLFDCGLTGNELNIVTDSCANIAIKEIAIWTEPIASIECPGYPIEGTALTLDTQVEPSLWVPSVYDETSPFIAPTYTSCGESYTDLDYEFYDTSDTSGTQLSWLSLDGGTGLVTATATQTVFENYAGPTFTVQIRAIDQNEPTNTNTEATFDIYLDR